MDTATLFTAQAGVLMEAARAHVAWVSERLPALRSDRWDDPDVHYIDHLSGALIRLGRAASILDVVLSIKHALPPEACREAERLREWVGADPSEGGWALDAPTDGGVLAELGDLYRTCMQG